MTFTLSLILAFIGGALLNLMPCVLPVLAVKAAGLVSVPGPVRRWHSLAYAAGVLISLLALASALLALRSAGMAVGWGFQLQSPVFVAALVYLFFLLGLSMLGAIPGMDGLNRLMGVGQELTEHSGARGAFFTGVLAVVVASPCTGPLMGAALGFALIQPPPIALVIFMSLGLGLASPMLVLSWVPGFARLLPKPGAWMQRFKELCAFPMFAAAVWLLWVLGRQAGSDAVAACVLGLMLLGFASWLWGSRGKPKWVARALGVVAIVASVLLIRDPLAPPAPAWAKEPYSAERLTTLLADGKPVFVELSADWCIICKTNEALVLRTDEVQHALRDRQFHYLKGDWTRYDPAITELLNKHLAPGVPLYLVFKANAASQPIVITQLLSLTVS